MRRILVRLLGVGWIGCAIASIFADDFTAGLWLIAALAFGVAFAFPRRA